MSLINKAAVKRAALDMASVNFKERNKTRLEMGLSPLKCVPSRVSKEFIDQIEGQVIIAINQIVKEHKSGVTL
jgi:hypothetical protein